MGVAGALAGETVVVVFGMLLKCGGWWVETDETADSERCVGVKIAQRLLWLYCTCNEDSGRQPMAKKPDDDIHSKQPSPLAGRIHTKTIQLLQRALLRLVTHSPPVEIYSLRLEKPFWSQIKSLPLLRPERSCVVWYLFVRRG